MGGLPVVLLLCSFHALTAVAQAQQTESPGAPGGTLPPNCREEILPRVYVINKEICMRTVCQQDEYLKAELCRELSGWPRRIERSTNTKRCRNRRSNPKTWANKA